MIIWGTSRLRPLDIHGMKNRVEFHREDHLDCLVGGNQGGTGSNFKAEADTYIQDILASVIVSYPGLNKLNIDNYAIAGKTVRTLLLHHKYHTISASIFLCNDPAFFRLSPPAALRRYFQFLIGLYQFTDFKIIFICTTLARRSELLKNSATFWGRRRFNDFLLADTTSSNPEFRDALRIRGVDGMDHVMEWRVVDMTDIIPDQDLRDKKYYCETRPDGTHFNAKYMELFLRKLAQEVEKYKSDMVVSPEPVPPRVCTHAINYRMLTRMFRAIDITDY